MAFSCVEVSQKYLSKTKRTKRKNSEPSMIEKAISIAYEFEYILISSKSFFNAIMKTKLNDSCPCGSGKKYKKCCMQKDQKLDQLDQTQQNTTSSHPMSEMISQDEFMQLMLADRHRSDWNLLSNRETYFGPNGQTYFVLRKVIEFALTTEPYPLWKKTNQEDRQEEMIALDIGSGPAIWSLALGEYFTNTRWITTEIAETLEIETKPTLNYLAKDYHRPLFEDCNGNVVYIGDSVSLQGLTNQNFNRKMGILVKKDSQHEGRYAICLCSGKVISIKAANIVKMNSHMGLDKSKVVSMDKALQESQKRETLIKQMLKDTRILDVTLDSSIAASKDLFGKCGLVTCTNLLRMVKHRHPDIWQDVLRVASLMLKENGILITYDAVDGKEGYGNFQEMHQYAHRYGLNLIHFGMPSPNDNTPTIPMNLKRELETLPGSRMMTFRIWRKW